MTRPVLHTTFFLLSLALLLAGWWLAGDPAANRAGDRNPGNALVDRARTEGPVDATFCGPLRGPLAPPPMDSPFGIHLYATSPRGLVTALPAMEMAALLPGPVQPNNESGKNGGGSRPVAAGGVPVNETAFDDVQTVGLLLEEFRRAFGAMPTGELNDEIVRRLQGENAKGIAVLPKSHPGLNSDGELTDRWGTPYRFHPESAWEMTVRSAGPDKKMWTSDDLLSGEPNLTTQL